MSKIGFRREVLGFNREDVIEYIRSAQTESTKRENELVTTVDKLNARNAELIDELREIPKLRAQLELSEATVRKLSEQVETLNEKRRELQSMSKDIAKMYLVARSNADALRESAKQTRERTAYETETAMHSLEQMHEQLLKIDSAVGAAAEQFTVKMKQIFNSFEATKKAVKESEDQMDRIVSATNAES